MPSNQSLYSILESLYGSHMLSQMALPSRQADMFGSTPFGRDPLQIISSGSRRAPMPQQQEQSGQGGLAGLIMAGGSLFQQGGPLFNYAGGSAAGSGWGNLMGQTNPGYFNVNTQAGLDSYAAATTGL